MFPQLHSDFNSLCIENVAIMMFSFYGKKTCGTAARKLVRIERFTIGVWCKAFTVENCSGKTSRHIWDNDIKVDI